MESYCTASGKLQLRTCEILNVICQDLTFCASGVCCVIDMRFGEPGVANYCVRRGSGDV